MFECKHRMMYYGHGYYLMLFLTKHSTISRIIDFDMCQNRRLNEIMFIIFLSVLVNFALILTYYQRENACSTLLANKVQYISREEYFLSSVIASVSLGSGYKLHTRQNKFSLLHM